MGIIGVPGIAFKYALTPRGKVWGGFSAFLGQPGVTVPCPLYLCIYFLKPFDRQPMS